MTKKRAPRLVLRRSRGWSLAGRSVPRVALLGIALVSLGGCSDGEKSCDDSDPCCSQCEPGRQRCEDVAFSEFPNREDTEALLAEMCPLIETWFLVGGRCSNSNRYVSFVTGIVNETHFFDASGAFLGMTTTTDATSGQGCGNVSYWPEPVECEFVADSSYSLCN